MTDNEMTRKSKFLSLVLRHEPERIGLKLDESGWTNVDELLQAINKQAFSFSRAELEEVVANNSKKRFAFSDDGLRIRANQGHSIEVDLQHVSQTPPEILYHGTATRFLDAIRKDGLKKMDRHDVHLSAESKMTLQVGGRHGKPALLTIRAGEMHRAGFLFRLTPNGVWLVDHVPPRFIEFPSE